MIPELVTDQASRCEQVVRDGLESRQEEVSTPVLVLDGIERRQVGLTEAVDKDLARLGHAEFYDRG